MFSEQHIIDVDSAIGFLLHVNVESVSDISEVHNASIYRVKISLTLRTLTLKAECRKYLWSVRNIANIHTV
jgi:hypothetical protein